MPHKSQNLLRIHKTTLFNDDLELSKELVSNFAICHALNLSDVDIWIAYLEVVLNKFELYWVKVHLCKKVKLVAQNIQ